jgi:adenosylhomocysteine nucleosidase
MKLKVLIFTYLFLLFNIANIDALIHNIHIATIVFNQANTKLQLTDSIKSHKTYGIIGAMPQEIKKVTSLMSDKKIIKHQNRTFYTGKIHGKNVVVVLARIGKVNAAITTTQLLENFDIDAVINIGVAGGQKWVKHLDLVISQSALYHDADATYFGSYKFGQIPHEAPEFLADSLLIKKAVKALDSLKIPYKIGRIASGDQFVYKPDMIENINNTYKNIYAIEMEAAAIAQTCHQYKVPFIIFRSISDVIGEKGQQEDFNIFVNKAADQAADLIIALLAQNEN